MKKFILGLALAVSSSVVAVPRAEHITSVETLNKYHLEATCALAAQVVEDKEVYDKYTAILSKLSKSDENGVIQFSKGMMSGVMQSAMRAKGKTVTQESLDKFSVGMYREVIKGCK